MSKTSARRARPGRFLVIEGIDGAGTTTQAEELRRRLARAGFKVHVTREPSEGPAGTLIRHALRGRLNAGPNAALASIDPRTLALLFAADRLDHLQSEIEPQLRAGFVVISDRYVLSSLAYQGLTLDRSWVAQINRFARPPDATFFLEVPVSVAERRRAQARLGRELFDARSVQQKVRSVYHREIRLRRRREKIEVIDGTRPVNEVGELLAERALCVLGVGPRP